ncbi:MAG: ribonuclease [Bacteroidota bacterium]|jgi:ribonuclease HI|nr:reverse transcriptase-like protein [Bacteroidia bacterium]NBY10652.1 reverse transcriptase-like protein [Sphingobacteriia bacterium]
MSIEHAIEVYTDGAASGNPGPGGTGIVLKYKNMRKELSCGYRFTTNNRMELRAVISALQAITNPALNVCIYSDSRYVVEAINKNWALSWKTKAYKGKANADLWEILLNLYKPEKHTFIWVKGHAANLENNRCDALAVNAAKQGPWLEDIGYADKNIK